MAKKRHPRRAPAVPTTTTTPSVPKPMPVVAKRSWWLDFEIDRDHLALVRFAFFAVLAVDAFLQIAHAPRYGADFNVEQLTWLPLPAPSRTIMVIVELLLAYSLALAAFGIGTRVVVPIAAALDFYAYFSSQLDSYQHHYLVVLLMIIACFVPWHARTPRVRSWALRLFCVQLAILYGWAAIAKMDREWVNGHTLELQIGPAWARTLISHLPGKFALAACGVMITELGLATAWCWPRLWRYALPIGVAFHISVEAAGFQIGQFSYVMLAAYTIMIPTAIARMPAQALARVKMPDLPPKLAMLVAINLGVACLYLSRIPEADRVVLYVSVIGALAFAVERHGRVALAHLAACLFVLGMARGTGRLLDYYRFWGHTAHLIGEDADARTAYLHVLDIDPDYENAHAALAEIAIARGDLDDARAHVERLEDLRPLWERTRSLRAALNQASGVP